VLRQVDREYLDMRGLPFTVYAGSPELLVLEGYALPPGYRPETADILIEVPDQYPDAKLDMWWVYPPVVFDATGAEPDATNVRQAYPAFAPEPNRQWQRFSRHPAWRPGRDDLRTFLGVIRSVMTEEARRAA
jgi:Prokaryotic E2 family E